MTKKEKQTLVKMYVDACEVEGGHGAAVRQRTIREVAFAMLGIKGEESDNWDAMYSVECARREKEAAIEKARSAAISAINASGIFTKDTVDSSAKLRTLIERRDFAEQIDDGVLVQNIDAEISDMRDTVVQIMCVGHIVDAKIVGRSTETHGQYDFEFVSHHKSGKTRLCLDFGQEWYIDAGETFDAGAKQIERAQEWLAKKLA